MPRRTPGARRPQGCGRKQSKSSSMSPVNQLSANTDAILVDLSSRNADSLTVPGFPQRGARKSQGRGRKQSGRSNVSPLNPPSANADAILVDLSSHNADSLTVPQFPQRGGRTRSQKEINRSRPVTMFPNELPPITGSLSAPQSSQRRGRCRSRGRINQSGPSRTPRNRPPPNRNSLSAPRSSRRGSRRNVQPRTRPTVISLDVTYSSDELESEIPSSPEKEPDSLLNFTLTPSSKGAESSDDDIHPHTSSPVPSPVKDKLEDAEENNETENWSSDYEEEDILFVDYNAKRDAALKRAFTEIRNMEKEETAAKKVMLHNEKSSCDPITPLDDEEASEKKSGDLDISCLDTPVKIPKKKRKGRDTVKKALESLKQFSEELSQLKTDGSFNGDIMVLSDTDDDAENEVLTLFVKFESNYIRCKVRQFQKFSSVYDDVADRLSLNVAQVLLCHDDKVICRDKCPVDLKLKYGDIIECGVQSQSAVQVRATVMKQSPGTIPLKVQNSDKKGVVTIFIRPDAKMKELMHRYAEEKNIPVEELRFSFDGETLNPNDTPKSLDLEGNECVDVYRK
ncbi:uncharacterized protein [Macrobrachium rosenbergii]|uniref:uncharacterized protein isoform X3 n=1 Tax=Macrobrachium rosenbergii TaxID=79674 RepID=UPI0034D6018C